MGWTITREIPDEEVKKPQWTITREVPETEIAQQPSQEQKPEFSWPRFLGEQMAQGAFTLPDLAHLLVGHSMNAQKGWGEPLVEELKGKHKPAWKNPLQNENEGLPEEVFPQPSSAIKELANRGIVNLESQGEGNTQLQKDIGKTVKYATGSIMPGAGIAGPLMGAATGAMSSKLEQAGLPSWAADLLGSVGAVGAPVLKNLIKMGLSPNKALSSAEAQVLKVLKQQMSPEEFQQTVKNLENQHQYTTMNYQPTTAEVANSTTLSPIHRVRYGMPESGLARQEGAQNQAIQNVIEPMMLNPSSSGRISGALQEEVKNLDKARHAASDALYEAVDKNATPVNPKLTKQYLKSKSHEKGGLKKEVEHVKAQIKPEQKITKADREYAHLYKNASPEIQAKMEKPVALHPEAKELAAAYREFNSRLEGLYKSGKKSKARIIREANQELGKDLEVIPEHKEAVSKYREFSKPINAIEKHPVLKNIAQPGANKVIPQIFTNTKKTSSADNIKALRNAIGKDEREWNGVREATVEHFHRSISNKQAQGTAHKVSYAKMDNFLKEHTDALKEVFTKEQMNFVDDLKHAIHGQNVAQTLAEGPNSATQAKTAIEAMLKQGVGLNKAEAFTQNVPSKALLGLKKPMQFMLRRWIEHNEKNALAVLDDVLLHPEAAHKLMTHKFTSQTEFNKYLKQLIPTTAVTLKGEKGEDHE